MVAESLSWKHGSIVELIWKKYLPKMCIFRTNTKQNSCSDIIRKKLISLQDTTNQKLRNCLISNPQ